MNEVEFKRIVEEGRALQQRLPDLQLVAVGGTAAALHCHHRLSLDVDHVTPFLGPRFEEVEADLARWEGWQTDLFKARMKHRNALEGTQSELVRGHGMRRAHYRGLAKVKPQNYFIRAACNVKRWIRREAWRLRQAMLVEAAQVPEAAAR